MKLHPATQAILDEARARVTAPGYKPPSLAETIAYVFAEHGETLRALAASEQAEIVVPPLIEAAPPVRHDPRREDVEGWEVDPTVGGWVR